MQCIRTGAGGCPRAHPCCSTDRWRKPAAEPSRRRATRHERVVAGSCWSFDRKRLTAFPASPAPHPNPLPGEERSSVRADPGSNRCTWISVRPERSEATSKGPPMSEPSTAAMPPRALARLQLHAGFTLDDAASQVDYYADLGISHLYASPLFAARPGSSHGYDVIDYHRINPELGGEPALRRLVEKLRTRGMGLVLDIVPNHMFAGPGNAWWTDLLRHGRGSRYAGYFDIDWHSPDPLVRGHVLLPILGQPYAQALRDGDVRLARQGLDYVLRVHDNPLPLAPPTVESLRGAG